MSKRIISLILVMTTLFSLVGCKTIRTPGIADNSNISNISSVPTAAEERKKRVVAEATEYLKENYPDDEFTYVSGRSPDWDLRYYEPAFTSKKYDDQKFTVYGVYPDGESTDVEIPYFPEVNTEQKFEYYDTYYQYYMKEDAEKYFRDLGNKYIGDIEYCEVIFKDSLYLAKDVDNKASFDDNMSNGNIHFNIRVKTSIDLTNQKQKALDYVNYLAKEILKSYVVIQYNKEDGSNSLFEFSIHDGIADEV